MSADNTSPHEWEKIALQYINVKAGDCQLCFTDKEDVNPI